MARIKRHGPASARRLSRRWREDKRRLSEGGGGGTARVEENAEPDYDKQNSQVEASLLVREQEIVEAIHELSESKDLLDDKISALKMATLSPDSDNVKRIKFDRRRSLELMDRISDLRRELAAVKLQQTSQQAKYRSSVAIVDQHLSSQEDNQGLVLGFLGHVWRLAEE